MLRPGARRFLCLAGLTAIAAGGCSRRGPARGDCSTEERAMAGLREAFPRLGPMLDKAREAAWRDEGGAYTTDWRADPRRFPRADANGQALIERFHPDGTLEIALRDRPAFQIAFRPAPPEPTSARTVVASGVAVRAGAFPDTDLFGLTWPTCGCEYMLMRSPRAPSRFEFEVTFGGEVRDARVVKAGSTELIELRDSTGAPRIRVFRPMLTDADRRKRPGHIDLRGSRLVMTFDLGGMRFPVVAKGDWSTTANMGSARYALGVSPLPDGKVLTTGGCSGTSCRDARPFPHCPGVVVPVAEIYDPKSGTWSYTLSPMSTTRFAHTASVLPGGPILIAGGCAEGGCTTALDSTEIYDPGTRRFLGGPRMSAARAHHTATTLPDGRILIVGGCSASACTASADLFDPTMRTISPAGKLGTARGAHVAAPMSGGRVLVAGGYSPAAVLASTEIWDPVAGAFGAGPPLGTARGGAVAASLPDGGVWVSGGCATPACSSVLASAERLDSLAAAWTAAPKLAVPRAYHAALALPGGRTLVSAGFTGPHDMLSNGAEILEADGSRLTATGKIVTPRAIHGMALLGDGRVLMTGGCDLATCLWHSETFDPASLPPPPDGGAGGAGGGAGGGEADGGPAPGDGGGGAGGTGGAGSCIDGAKPWALACDAAPGRTPLRPGGLLALAVAIVVALRRRARPAALIVALSLAAGGCHRATASAIRERVIIGWSALRISAPVMVAASRGLFERHGLDVDLRRYDTAQPLADDLGASRLDAAGYVAYPIIVEAMAASGARPAFVTEILEDAAHPLCFLVRKKGAPIASIADLRGKRVGILPTLAYRRWIETILERAGVPAGEVSIQPIPPALEPAALASGAVDALFTGDPPAAGAIASGAGERVPIAPPVPAVFGEPFPFGTFAVGERLRSDRPAAAEAIRAALDEAIALLSADQEVARAAMRQMLPEAQRPLVARFEPLRYRTSAEVRETDLQAALAAQRATGAITREIPVHVMGGGGR